MSDVDGVTHVRGQRNDGSTVAGGSRRVLVVGSDADLGTLLSIVLDEAGYETELAATTEAMSTLRRRRPDLVIVDDRLRGVGSPASGIWPSRRWWDDIPVLVLSARASTDGYTADAPVLRKPFGLDALLERVRHMAGEPSPSLQARRS